MAVGHDLQFRQIVALWLFLWRFHGSIVRNRNFSSEIHNPLYLSYLVCTVNLFYVFQMTIVLLVFVNFNKERQHGSQSNRKKGNC